MAATAMPRLNALRGSLRDRADEHRMDDEQSSEQSALDNGGGLAALAQTRSNNLKSRVMAMNNPGWDEFFQSIRDTSGGAPVRLVGGASPEGSNQITGLGDSGPNYGSVNALRGRARSMPDSHDAWLAKTRQRIYGEAQS